jgi:hypothetical protein
MSELAFNSNGDSFDVPATVSGWRVRRMKPRGAPELVYGRDGRPLTVPIEADIDALRDAVGTSGKYRLDPINDDGKCVEGVPPAYVQVVKPERDANYSGSTIAPAVASDDTLREAMRLNTDLAKSVIDRFPEMMHAAAELLRAADGAGLPARQPRKIEEEDDEDDAPAPSSSPAFEFVNTLVAQVVPIVVSSLANKGMPKLGAILDWRKAAPDPKQLESSTQALTTESKPEPELPPLDPNAMSHFIAIQSALTPREAALARRLASELSPAEIRAWFAELSTVSVADAVARIRAFIERMPKSGGAS